MSDIAFSPTGRAKSGLMERVRRVGTVLRDWRSLRPAGRLRDSVRAAELDGLAFAFRARALAILVVSAWLFHSSMWPRNVYYLAFAGAFFVLGFIPYRLRHHRRAEWIKLAFVVLDVLLVTVAIMLPPPVGAAIDWPVQTRVRGPEFLYLLLLLAEAALTYSPVAVIWTGAAIAAIWSAGQQIVYGLPTTLRFADIPAAERQTSADILRIVYDPTYLGLGQWRLQMVATGLFTAILALAVWRSRRTLLAHVQAEVVRSDLARYVSPDVADALAAKAPDGFGEPATRTVAVMFADMKGFTAITERYSPERTFALLRSFQVRSCRVVFKHGGTLDKYLGDGFMATFGGLGEQPDAAARALACAFELQEEFARWNAKRSRRSSDAIQVAIGLHCGPVVVGNIGAESRIEFTVVGDVVNVACRIEQSTREYGGEIAASDDCLRAAGAETWAPRFDRSVDVTLRGREQGTQVHIAGSAAA